MKIITKQIRKEIFLSKYENIFIYKKQNTLKILSVLKWTVQHINIYKFLFSFVHPLFKAHTMKATVYKKGCVMMHGKK